MTAMSVTGERVVTALIVTGLVVYAACALVAHRWLSGLAAPAVAILLATRHPRARFAAYVFFSALTLRGLVAGGWAMVAFAKLNPDTPGKLTAHAYSYEHMELAAYELLGRVASRAGERAVVELAQTIGAQERAMA